MDDTQFKVLQGIVDSQKPSGDWSGKPAVPATTVPVTNNSGRAMIVEINANGATIAAVKLDGVTVGGSTARVTGSFHVRNGGTIAITYTVATPTWQWFSA